MLTPRWFLVKGGEFAFSFPSQKVRLLVFFHQLIWLIQFNQFSSMQEFFRQWEINLIAATHTPLIRLVKLKKFSWFPVGHLPHPVVSTLLFWKFMTCNICWLLINILFLYFINSVAFIRKIGICCFCKNSVFPGYRCVFEFSCPGNRTLAEIWVLNHFSKMRLSFNFEDLAGFRQKQKCFCLKQFRNVKWRTICAKGNRPYFVLCFALCL